MALTQLPTQDLTLGQRIRLGRVRKNLSQDGLTERLNEITVSERYTQTDVSRWERDERVPNNEQILDLAIVLELPLSYFGEDYTAAWERIRAMLEEIQHKGGYVADLLTELIQPTPRAAAATPKADEKLAA